MAQTHVISEEFEKPPILLFDNRVEARRIDSKNPQPICGVTSGRNHLGQLNGTLTLEDIGQAFDLMKGLGWINGCAAWNEQPKTVDITICVSGSPARSIAIRGIKPQVPEEYDPVAAAAHMTEEFAAVFDK